MFAIFKKKKLSEDQLSSFFVNSLLTLTDSGFEDVIEIIKNDPEFVAPPQISDSSYDQFLLIVVAGNLKILSRHFESVRDVRITEAIYKRLANTLGVDYARLKETIAKYQSWMSRINHPSKNTHYAMSKAVFFKFELNQYQSDYFKNMNTPNPIFLKRLDDLIGQFILNWDEIKEDYRIA